MYNLAFFFLGVKNHLYHYPHLYRSPHLILRPSYSLRKYHNPAAAPAFKPPSPPFRPPPFPPLYSPAPADLNLDQAGKPLSFSSAIRGPHGKEWTLADEQELIKLLVTLKCLLPVNRTAKPPTYLKRVVKEKWDEIARLSKRRVRWTIGGDKIDVEYDVGTNTATLPTVNAVFHSIVSPHSFIATIDIVDYYLGATLSSPESVRIDMSSIFLPTLTKLGLLPFLRHSHGKPFLLCDVLKTAPGLPQSAYYPNFVLSPFSPNTASLKLQHPCSFATTPTPLPSPLS